MIIRLGFVAMSLKLKDASPSKTVTYKSLMKRLNDEVRLYHLKKLTKTNLENTMRILIHAKAFGIEVYRLTSKLIPLATHTDVLDWNYIEGFKDTFIKIGNFIKENNIRISAHPDHFTILNSPRKDVIEASFRDLEYHKNIFDAMGLGTEAKLVIHVGGVYSDKKQAIIRFKNHFNQLSPSISKRIILENDDKCYTVSDVLDLSKALDIPTVLDVHHYTCNKNSDEKLSVLLPQIFETWHGQILPPKIHFSSPKSEKQFRHHADNINTDDFINFLDMARILKKDIDVMLEAKNKDIALFNLVDDLKKRRNINFISEGSFSY